MNLYQTLDTAYAGVARRTPPTAWNTGCGRLDEIVTAIRDHRPDPTRSDTILRHLLTTDQNRPDATTVVLYALAPALRARLARAFTDDYRNDTLTDLAFVLLDTTPHMLDRPGLAHRLVNRAHTHAHKAARRTHQRGAARIVTIAPTDPAHLADRPVTDAVDVAELAAARVDLNRFLTAAATAVATGQLSPSVWTAYRAHRLARAVDPHRAPCTGVQRQLAGRAAARLRPLVDTHLHAA